MFLSKSLPSVDTYLGQLYSPESIFFYKTAVLGSSKGKNPHIIANRMTPQDQMSTCKPWYVFPATISGAA